MKKLLVLIVGIFLSTAAITPAFATGIVCGQSCQAILTIGEGGVQQVFDLSSLIIPAPTAGLFALPSTERRIGDVGFATVSALINPDPSIAFSLSGTNFTASPLFFGLHLETPISLTGAVDASSSIAYTLTDNAASPGVQLVATPNSTVAVFRDFIPPITVIDKLVDVGPTVNTNTPGNCNPLVAGGTTTCPAFPLSSYSRTSTFFLGGTATVMSVDIGLRISPFDTFSLSGQVTQNPSAIPEPASLLLIGTGLLGLAGWRRYSSRG